MKKRSIVVSGHATSITLEEEFWLALNEIARTKKTSLSVLVSMIDREKKGKNLSSAIRIFVLKAVQNRQN